MADIYTVLLSSLRKAKATDARHREDVYARARIAYFHKLLGHRPRLDDTHIEDMMSVFDLAVAFVESDVAPTLPTRRTKDLDAAVALLLERQLANTDFAAEIKFDFSERDIEAEREPEAPDAYRTHVRQAAARVSEWTEMMVKKIDPASVAALSFASASTHDGRTREWAVRSPNAAREAVDVRSAVAAPEPERETSRLREIRLLRTFFPQEAGDGTIAPGHFETLTRRVVRFFEGWSAQLYEAGVTAERERRQSRLRPRVLLRTPRYDEAASRQRRVRRRVVSRVVPPTAALITVGVLAWVSNSYGPQIVDRVEEGLRPREEVRVEAPPPVPEAVIPKTEIAAGGSATNARAPDITLFDGADAGVFVANDAHPIKLLGEADDRFVRIASSLTDSADARLVIPPAIADRMAGREAHIVVAARTATEDGSGTVRFAYQAGDEVTAFVAQPLGKDYRRLEMVWNVPGGSSLGQHSILIEPGLLGGGSSVDIKSAVIYLAR